MTEGRHTELVGITSNRIKILGCHKVPLVLGSTTLEHEYFVCADRALSPAEGLMRQDMLMPKGIGIISSRGIPRIGGDEILPLICVPKMDATLAQSADSLQVDVHLAEEVTLPAMSKKYSFGTGSSTPKLHCCCQASRQEARNR